MILVDTSVWIAHFRKGEARLVRCLRESRVLTHPFVIGELACGTIRNRKQTLNDLNLLPFAVPATDNEVVLLVEKNALWGFGIGWIDAHLLASARLSDCRLWTFDRRLAQACAAAGVKPY